MSFPTTSVSGTPDPATHNVIAHELHRTAQPLTVLQGLLELALISSRTAEEYKSVIHRAIEESRRISGCFDLVRRLFHSHELTLGPSSFSVSDMVRTVVETVSASYLLTGVGCEFQPLAYDQAFGADEITAPEGRVSTAVALVLSDLFRWAKAGGTVEVAVEADSENVLVRAEASRQKKEAVAAQEAQLDPTTGSLLLARNLVTSAGGRIERGESGSSILICLPKSQRNPEICETQRIESVHV